LKPQYAKGKVSQTGKTFPYAALKPRMFINPKCHICGTDDLDILDLHHIDRDRGNEKLENLVVLCANHHRKVHRHPELLEDDSKLMKVDSSC
jgi:5-methylcytosine-specific restriction endonuclease McrA